MIIFNIVLTMKNILTVHYNFINYILYKYYITIITIKLSLLHNHNYYITITII